MAWLEARSRAVGPIPRSEGGRRGSRPFKAGAPPVGWSRPGSSRVPSPFGLPFPVVELRRQESNLRLPVNSRAPVPARTPPESSRQKVGMAGFEPAISCSQGRRIGQAFLHPESAGSPTSAQRESNPHVRHGKAVGYRYIMGTIAVPELSRS